MGGSCTHVTCVITSRYICFTKPLALLVVLFSFEQTNIFPKRMRRLVSVSVNYISGERHTNLERFSLWENPNKSYTCVLASLARYRNATVTGFLLELHLTRYKKYHLLFPNYTTISSFVPIKETEAFIPAAETLPSK